jgi:AmiR/NasT family two-component response regulator
MADNGQLRFLTEVVQASAELERDHEQLQEALESRLVIEQAKGITSQRHSVTLDEAYSLMRSHARNHSASLRAVAEAIVSVGLAI